MSRAKKLINQNFINEYLRAKLLPLYPQFKDILNIEIIPHKKHIWPGEAYHLVIEYSVFFINQQKEQKNIKVFCSAHWEEPRINVYTGLHYLWEHNFNEKYLKIPRPLFYSKQFRGVFYEGIEGRNLYRFIREADKKEIKKIIPKAAKWFAKLHHQIDSKNALNFNEENSRIKTVIPGVEHILFDIKKKYPEYLDFYKKAYEGFIKREEYFFKKTDKLYLVHGDAHPENIIKIDKKSVGVIDFTDLCLSDFARDIGTFSQQLIYMCHRKIKDLDFADKMLKLFLKKYKKYAKIKIDKDLQERIDNYYNWTMLRTATFFLIKHNPEPERGMDLIEKLKRILDI